VPLTPAQGPRRVSAGEFRALPLEVHALLAEIPLKDVTAIDLVGGGPGKTLRELRPIVTDVYRSAGSPVVRSLFAFRAFLGRVLKWDESRVELAAPAFSPQIPAALAARSQLPRGTPQGPLKVLYELDHESLAEGQNATVHAFMCQALLPLGDGYRLYWAVYVRRISWFTPLYMALIEPFRRFVVYPSLLSRVSRAWTVRHAPEDAREAR
jgi:Protein of unknown function (DUF2867)